MGIHEPAFRASPAALFIVDAARRIVGANARAEELLGYDPGELTRSDVVDLIPERFRERHVRLFADYMDDPSPKALDGDFDLAALRKDGEEVAVDLALTPIDSAEGPQVLCEVHQAGERKTIERLTRELAKKEMLLKEVHHRVKNNLSVLSSIFYLQSTISTDETVMRVLRENQDRVRSMALVHERLYSSGDYATLDFEDYVEGLSQMVLDSYFPDERNVRLSTRLDPVRLGIDTAVPCALVLNELICNALHHGFPEGRGGDIVVTLRKSGAECEISVADTGAGVTPGVERSPSPSMGLKLIHSLATQLDGTFSIEPGSPGTTARFRFPLEIEP